MIIKFSFSIFIQDILNDPKTNSIFWNTFDWIHSYLKRSDSGNKIIQNTITSVSWLKEIIMKLDWINNSLWNLLDDKFLKEGTVSYNDFNNIFFRKKNELLKLDFSEKDIKTVINFFNNKQLDIEFSNNIKDLLEWYLLRLKELETNDFALRGIRQKYENQLSLKDKLEAMLIEEDSNYERERNK